MMNFDDVIKENINKHNPNWSQVPDYLYRILLIGGSGSGKTILLFNLISQKPEIDKINLQPKDPYKAKYQYLINKRESTSINHFNESEAFIEYSNDKEDIYKNVDEYNPNKKCKILLVFYDMISDILSNKKT